jgi:cysteine synthase
MLKPMDIYKIGQTPICELSYINGNKMLLKLEQFNFLGSVKARTGYAIINALDVHKSIPIIESSSGNLGLSLDFFCNEEGREFICLLDETIPLSKIKLLDRHGVNYVIVPTEKNYDERESRNRYAQKLMDAGTHFWVNQYDNENGVKIHEDTTAPEIIEQTGNEVTCVVIPVGSGGVISGVGKYLKKYNPCIKIIGVEPYGSTIFDDKSDVYLPVGAGYKGKPGNVLRNGHVIDFSYSIKDNVSIEKCKMLKKQYGLDVGITTGMAYAAAEIFCATNRRHIIVILSPDGAESYQEIIDK